jgi:hypothetical protein
LFIAQQTGEILIHDGSQVLATPFLDLGSLIVCCGERGLLGLAFHPDYGTNGLFFVNYTNLAGDTVVAEYSVSAGDANQADPSSARVLLTVDQPDLHQNHNGGHLAFGPDDYLYIGLGDGGGGGDPEDNGQDPTTLLGSLLRIDVDATDPGLEYAVPTDNPFVGNPGAADEAWAYGLRNPWRYSFDRATGDLFIGDVGQGSVEEIDFQPVSSTGGENYGWNLMEGSTCFGGGTDCNDGSLVLPILEYNHDVGRSVTGGYRYRGDEQPRLRGVYLYADYVFGTIWGTVPRCDGAWLSQVLVDTPHSISTFGEDAAGEVYVARYSSSTGAVYRLVVAQDAGGTDLLASPTPVDFGPVQVGDTGSAELLLTNGNAGPEALLMEGMTVSDPTHFAVNVNGGSSPCGSLTPCLQPGVSCTVEVTFSSPTPGVHDASITVTGNSPAAVVPVSGTAYDPCVSDDHRVLPSETVSDTRIEQACLSITAGPYNVVSPGDVTFSAGETIVFRNGFSLGSGASFTAAIDPLLALP